MKRLFSMICVMTLCIASVSGIAFASDDVSSGDVVAEPSNVTITVVMPAPEAEQPPVTETVDSSSTPDPIKVYPSDVTELHDESGWQIIKTYELDEGENPADIPRESFERNGYRFTLTDILRKETATAETREHTETVTLNTDSKDLEQILPLFSQTMEHRAEDGFVGVLSLDVASITVETAGTKTSSYTMSVTREYPHLSTNDTSLVPKTVTDRGSTYTLAGVDWKAGNYVTIDYEQVPEYYTAVATYTATGTTTKVTGYVTTAVYTGTLAKLSQGKTIYTAYFLGEEIRTPLEIVEPAPETEVPTGSEAPIEGETDDETTEPSEESGKSSIAWFALLPCVAVFAGGAVYFIMRRKTTNAKNHDNVPAASDSGNHDRSRDGG